MSFVPSLIQRKNSLECLQSELEAPCRLSDADKDFIRKSYNSAQLKIQQEAANAIEEIVKQYNMGLLTPFELFDALAFELHKKPIP